MRTILFSISISAALLGTAAAQPVFPGGPRYDGDIKIVNLAGGSCPNGQVGQVYPAAYRLKPGPNSQREEAITIAIPRPAGGLYLEARGGDGTFPGKNQSAIGTLLIDAYRTGLDDIVLNLDFSPNKIDETVAKFSFKGTVKNYLFKGCTATIRGEFIKR